jgi:hypothetical protein
MKIIKYVDLLIRYEVLKIQDKKNLSKLDKLQTENQTLRQCLLNEEKRTGTFRNSYRKKLNECEDLQVENLNQTMEIKKLERKIKNGKYQSKLRANKES